MAKDGLYEEVIIAGFGGQGIILTGKLLAQAAMKAGKEVTYMPSYGAEVRGGTANCMVVIAEKKIACPVVGRRKIKTPTLERVGVYWTATQVSLARP